MFLEHSVVHPALCYKMAAAAILNFDKYHYIS